MKLMAELLENISLTLFDRGNGGVIAEAKPELRPKHIIQPASSGCACFVFKIWRDSPG